MSAGFGEQRGGPGDPRLENKGALEIPCLKGALEIPGYDSDERSAESYYFESHQQPPKHFMNDHICTAVVHGAKSKQGNIPFADP